MKINKLGTGLFFANFIIVFGMAIADGMLRSLTVTSMEDPSGMNFVYLMMILNPIPFLLLFITTTIPVFKWLYVASSWIPFLHFVILGGIQWYLIGWGVGALWNRKRKKNFEDI